LHRENNQCNTSNQFNQWFRQKAENLTINSVGQRPAENRKLIKINNNIKKESMYSKKLFFSVIAIAAILGIGVVSCKKPVESVTLDKPTLILIEGESEALTKHQILVYRIVLGLTLVL
jgi:hypothetical protein